MKTNAFIEAYQRYRHRADDPVTHIWNRFDVIVWDECHSLTVDSTYQSAPFYVQRLMEETFSRIMAARKNEELPETERNPGIKPPRCKNIILMTGTPEPLSKVRLPVEASILDLRDQCRVVQPKNIHFVEKAQAEEQIKEQLQAGERVLYFSNHIVPAAELAERYGIARERVVMSFSDETRRQQLKETDAAEGNEDAGDYHRLLSVQEHLEKYSRIREDITLFVTTSKNKEGININDDDVRHVYIESHSMTDICQMAGRLRHGAENVYIILDSQGHPPSESRFDSFFAEHICQHKLEDANQPPVQVHLLDDMLREVRQRAEWKAQVSSPEVTPRAFVDELPDVKAFIDYVLEKTPYLMYDYFTGTFKINVYRKLGNKHMNEELAAFGEAKADPDKLVQLFQRYFPASEVHRPCDRTEQASEYLNAYLEKHPENCFSSQELTEIVDHLAEILNYPSGDDGVKPNRILHQLGYHTDRRSHKKENPEYQNFKIVSLE